MSNTQPVKCYEDDCERPSQVVVMIGTYYPDPISLCFKCLRENLEDYHFWVKFEETAEVQ